jgi:hypothetical protein
LTKEERKPAEESPSTGINGFFNRYGPNIVLAILIAYVILLAIGTVAEIFKIQSILDWWIWSPPGK